jgi:hypothetical protein
LLYVVRWTAVGSELDSFEEPDDMDVVPTAQGKKTRPGIIHAAGFDATTPPPPPSIDEFNKVWRK